MINKKEVKQIMKPLYGFCMDFIICLTSFNISNTVFYIKDNNNILKNIHHKIESHNN